jgi:transposase
MGKNPFIKGAKVFGQKFSLIVRCFATDVTASDCAQIVKVNRKTADRYYHYFRRLVLKQQAKERRQFLSETKTEIDEAYFGPTRVRGKRGRGASRKIAVVGLLERNGKVFTKPIDRCTKKELMPIILAKVKQGADIYTDGWKSYDALAVYGFNHKKIKHEDNQFSNGNGNHINGVESFWSFAKRRLLKFNGIRKTFFSDYLKETEWRFNNRGKIEQELRKLIREAR